MLTTTKVPRHEVAEYIAVNGEPVDTVDNGGDYITLIYEVAETVEEAVSLFGRFKSLFQTIKSLFR